MSTAKANNFWDKISFNEPESDIRNALGKYEAQYKRILGMSGGGLLHQRNFQIGIYVLISICFLMFGYISPYTPYFYLLSLVGIAVQWYMFYLSEKLRAAIKVQDTQQDALAYFRRRRDIIIEAAYLQKVTYAQSAFIFAFIWFNRPPERLFDIGGITMPIFIGIMVIAVAVHYRIKVAPLVTYLKGLVIQLESEAR